MFQDISGTARDGFRVGTRIARESGCRFPKRPMSVVVSRDHLSTLRSICNSTLAIFLDTKYQVKWQPIAGFEEHGMLSTRAVSRRAYLETLYQRIMHEQATI